MRKMADYWYKMIEGKYVAFSLRKVLLTIFILGGIMSGNAEKKQVTTTENTKKDAVEAGLFKKATDHVVKASKCTARATAVVAVGGSVLYGIYKLFGIAKAKMSN
jgi:phage FluMu protein gp41